MDWRIITLGCSQGVYWTAGEWGTLDQGSHQPGINTHPWCRILILYWCSHLLARGKQYDQSREWTTRLTLAHSTEHKLQHNRRAKVVIVLCNKARCHSNFSKQLGVEHIGDTSSIKLRKIDERKLTDPMSKISSFQVVLFCSNRLQSFSELCNLHIYRCQVLCTQIFWFQVNTKNPPKTLLLLGCQLLFI
jgi:hypothetical protein